MRAVVIEEFGDPDGMTMAELPDPVPTVDQVAITTEAIGVGGVDAVIRRGTLRASGSGSGFAPGLIPGSEVAGTVTAVGDGVDSAWLGRRVWAFTGTGGAYATVALARITDLIELPGGLSSVDAVTLGSAVPVAHFTLAHARLAAGESVLVRGAAGSIGLAVMELALQRGARTVAATTSSPERGMMLRGFGATHVLDRSGSTGTHVDTGTQTDTDAPASYDVIIDVVGGPELPRFIELLAPNGRLVLVGIVGGYPPPDFGMALMRSFQRSRSFATFSLDTVPVAERDAYRRAAFAAAARGDLRSVVHDTMPLERAADAHRAMDAGEVVGRIVLIP